MINKDGKLFGKISIVDIAVILIIVLIGVGVYCRFAKQPEEIISMSEKIECTFLIENVRTYTVDALKKKGEMYDGTSKELIGNITDVRVEDGKMHVNMADGSFKTAAPENRYNVYVTVEFSGKISDKGYYTAANKYLAVGTSAGINTKYVDCGATVYSINKAE